MPLAAFKNVGHEFDGETVVELFPKGSSGSEAMSNSVLPESTGIWSNDNRAGRQAALDLVHRMRVENSPVLLGRTAKSIMAAGIYGGVEVGFFQQIAELAIR